MAMRKFQFTDEEREKVHKLYNKGVSILQISLEIGHTRKSVKKAIDELIASGEWQERDCMIRKDSNTTRGRTEAVKVKIAKINDLYGKGLSIDEISEEIKLNTKSVRDYIKELRNAGQLLTPPPKPKKEKPKAFAKRPARVAEPTLPEGKTIKCSVAVAETCVYGGAGGACRYSSVTGKCRSVGKDGCKREACTKYSKISPTNPKLKGMDE